MSICPVCENSGNPIVRRISEFALHLCRRCRLRYSNPMSHPGKEWYEKSEIYHEVEWNLPPISKLGERWEFRRALSHLNGIHGTVFDVGCGRGDFLALAKKHGYQVSGLDLNESLLKVAERTYGITDTYSGSVEDFIQEKKLGEFACVTAFEVMEHLPDPRQFVRQCGQLLQSTGKVILSVPGFYRWPHWVNSDVDLPPHHLTLWSEESLKEILQSQGYKDVWTERKPLLVTDVMYHAVRWIPGLQAPGLFRKLLRGVLKVAVMVLLPFLRLHPRAGGFTLLVVGTR